MTPLARTAIFPATVFTPCLNCAMSGPEGSMLSKPEARPEEGESKGEYRNPVTAAQGKYPVT